MSHAAHATPSAMKKMTKRDLELKIKELEKEVKAAQSDNEALRARVEKVEDERDFAVIERNRIFDLLLQTDQVNGELRQEIARLKDANELLNETLHPELFPGN